MSLHGVPFLTVSEFIRAKLRSWAMYVAILVSWLHVRVLTDQLHSRGSERDAQDISYVLTRYWNRVDANRIPEEDMNRFVARIPAAAPGWSAIKNKYGM